MKVKYLPLYYKWKRNNDDIFLCNELGYEDEFLKLFKPSRDEFRTLAIEGFSICAWAHGQTTVPFPDYKMFDNFTPLRQNILLFMAAMNNEL